MKERIDITETLTYLDEVIDENLTSIALLKKSLENDLVRLYILKPQSKEFTELLLSIKLELQETQLLIEKNEVIDTFLQKLLKSEIIKNNACDIEQSLISILENKSKNLLKINETNKLDIKYYIEEINNIETLNDEEMFYEDDNIEMTFYEDDEDEEPESEEEMHLDKLRSSCANMYDIFDDVQQGLINFLKDYKNLLDYYEENNLTDNEEYIGLKKFIFKLQIICRFSNTAINKFKDLYEHYEEKYDEYRHQLTL